MKTPFFLLFVAFGLMAGASHIAETVHLSKGWNAIYLESTPDNPACSDFFAGSPVVSVGSYSSDAYESTAQYRRDGSEINQKPLSYSVWFADAESGSALRSLFGGRCYLVYATNVWEKTFYGIPAQPHVIWRKADTNGNGFMNLAGVSCGGATTPAETTAAAYFGPGPFGAKGTVYQIGGLNPSAPSFLPISFGSKVTLKPGLAYAVTSERADDWPGVVRIRGTGPMGLVDFGTRSRKTSFTIDNASTMDRTFTLVCRSSADAREMPLVLSRRVQENPLDDGTWMPVTNDVPWSIDLKAGEGTTLQLALDRTGLTNTNVVYGSVLEVRDESGSKMRVRVPLTAAVDPVENRTAGLWVGAVQLTHVSQITNATPVAAGGTMKLTTLLHVSTNGTMTLLPKVMIGGRRITGGMMSLENTGVANTLTGAGFGTIAQFDFAVAAGARDNPFRHAWHPDHANTGANGIAVSNEVQFVWKEGIDRCKEAAFLDRTANWLLPLNDPDDVTAGYVIWKMKGLAKETVTVVGRFALQRLVSGELEEIENEQ